MQPFTVFTRLNLSALQQAFREAPPQGALEFWLASDLGHALVETPEGLISLSVQEKGLKISAIGNLVKIQPLVDWVKGLGV